jgi:hypothetical protein
MSKMMEFARSSSNLRTFCRAISSGFNAGSIGPMNVNGVFEDFPFLLAAPEDESACFSDSDFVFGTVVELLFLKKKIV